MTTETTILICQLCNARFEPAHAAGGRAFPTKWCSRACQQKAFRERHAESLAAARRQILELRAELAEALRQLGS